jgi:uncharacterized protein (UPF0276 family)
MLMAASEQEFLRRVAGVPHHGIGLSVDVYQPDLFELVAALHARGLMPGYLEIFKAATAALAEVRRRLPSTLLAYHAEGLWVTQPDGLTRYPVEEEVTLAAEQLTTLGSHWANYEGASKQIAGYSFGTYLPPLFTRAAAEVTAENLAWVQSRLDHLCDDTDDRGPLVLLETPPLSYFGFGDVDMAEFFHRVTELAPCGLVLDVGHLWTMYRYSGAWRRSSLSAFLTDFLERFPLERVVHLHVAGLAVYDGTSADPPADPAPGTPPWWVDAHAAPIPEVLYDMLERIVSHPRLAQARGLALEVDNKAIPLIADEFDRFSARFHGWASEAATHARSARTPAEPRHRPQSGPLSFSADRQELLQQYDAYAKVVAGLADPAAAPLPRGWLEPGALDAYRRHYLRDEILHWGGELRDMFPETCKALDAAGIALEEFIAHWFRGPRYNAAPYDFFLLKVDRFLEFVVDRLPAAVVTAAREADELRQGYQAACEAVTSDR